MLFDASLSLCSISFPHPSKALAEVRCVTKPGRKIPAAVWDQFPEGMDAPRILGRGGEYRRYPRPIRRKRLRRAGRFNPSSHGDRAFWRTSRNNRPLTISMRFESVGRLLGRRTPAGFPPEELWVVDRVALCASRSRAENRHQLKDLPLTLSARVRSVCGVVRVARRVRIHFEGCHHAAEACAIRPIYSPSMLTGATILPDLSGTRRAVPVHALHLFPPHQARFAVCNLDYPTAASRRRSLQSPTRAPHDLRHRLSAWSIPTSSIPTRDEHLRFSGRRAHPRWLALR